MNKKILRKVTTIFMTILMISTIVINSFALTPSEMKGDMDAPGTEQLQVVGNSIIGILQVVGIVLSVVILIVLGIKYMMGSAEEKAEYKKTMMPYIVGAALIFMASVLAQVIFGFFTGIQITNTSN